MPHTIKTSTVLWAVGGLLAPFVLLDFLYAAGLVGLSSVHVWIISLPLCGYFAYRSYKQGLTRPATPGDTPPNVTTQPAALSGSARFGMALLGAGVGFGLGFLTRPTLLGQKLPLALLFEPAPPEFAQAQSDYILHMAVATVIGLVAALALTMLVASVRRS